MAAILTITLWTATLLINLTCAPRHTLTAYGEDTGKAKYVPWALMILTSVGAVWAQPLTLFRVIAGVSLFAVGTLIAVRALHDNPFFRGDLVAPPFRITTGLYRYLDHPGYLGFAIRCLGIILIAETEWNQFFGILYVAFLQTRVAIEDDLLADL